MTIDIPSPPAAAVDAEEQAAFERMRADSVIASRSMSAGQFIAGLLAAAELESAGTPEKLPAETWPDVDPVAAQEIWNQACLVAWRAARYAGSSRLSAERLQALQDQLAEAGFHAMAQTVGRSRQLVARAASVHPGDGQIARDHE